MQPIKPTPPAAPTALPNQPPPPTGWTATFGGWIIGNATKHEGGVDLKEKKFRHLIDDFAKQAASKIVADSKSSFVAGGKEHIEGAIRDLLTVIIQKFGYEKIPAGVTLSDEELADHFFASIISKITKEFSDKPNISPKDHFKNIAEELLKTAFPQKLNDPQLPKALRDILSGSGMYSWATYLARIDTSQFSWDKITALFADHLEEVYSCMTSAAAGHFDEKSIPGGTLAATKLSQKIVGTEFSIPLLDKESNDFVTGFLERLFKGKIYARDKETLDLAKGWLMGQMQQTIKAVLSTLFESKEKRLKMAENLVAGAGPELSKMLEQQAKIKKMSDSELNGHLTTLLADPAKADFHARAKEALKSPEEAKLLLSELAAYSVVESLLSKEVDLKRLQAILPKFLSPQKALGMLYSAISPYVLEIASQCSLLVQEAEKTKVDAELSGWIDWLGKTARSMLQTKAEAQTLGPSSYQFLNEMVCHIVLPSSLSGLNEANAFVDKLLKSIVTIIAQKIIDKHKAPGETAGVTLTRALNLLLDKAKAAVVEFSELKKKGPISQEEEAKFFTTKSRELLKNLIDEESFNALLPPFLRKMNPWQMAADYIATYLKGIYAQTDKMQAAGVQKLQVPALQDLKKKFTTQLNEMLTTPGSEDTTAEKMKRKLLEGETAKTLLGTVVPQLIESILAFHLNDEKDAPSTKRAATLFLKILNVMQAGFDKIEQYNLAKDKKLWLQTNGYTEEVIEKFKKANDLPAAKEVDIRELILRQASQNMVLLLLPESLRKNLIPEEFAIFGLEGQLANLAYNYLKQAYNSAQAMKAVSGMAEMMKGLDSFVQKQIETMVAAKPTAETSWFEQVLRQVYTTQSETQKATLNKFSQNLLYGSLGLMLANAKSIRPGADLLTLFVPILLDAQQTFHILNDPTKSKEAKLALLKIGDHEKKEYFKARGVPATELKEINQLAYYVTAKRAIDHLFNEEQWKGLLIAPFLTKSASGILACPVIQMVHELQRLFEEGERSGLVAINREPGLKAYVDKKIITQLVEVLGDVGSKKEPLSKSLPPLLDNLVKQLLSDDKSKVADIRKTIVERVTYTLVAKQVNESEALVPQLEELIDTFNKGDQAKAARMLLELLLPKQFFDLELAKMITNEALLPEISSMLAEIATSLSRIKGQAAAAKQYLEGIEGVPELLTDIMKSLDESLDEMARDKAPISDEMPPFFDGELKKILTSKKLNPIVKEAARSLTYICLQHLLTPKKGQSLEDHVQEVAARFIALYNAGDPAKTGAEWLKELIPVEMLQNLLPEFLKGVVTHEKLVEWFLLPYVKEVGKTVQDVAKKAKEPAIQEAAVLQNYVKSFLLEFTKESATRRGLSGYVGAVHLIEQKIIAALSHTEEPVGKTMESYLNTLCSQITGKLSEGGYLSKTFLADGLIASLPSLAEATPLPDKVKDFKKETAAILLKKLFPNDEKDLAVPDVAKKAVWNKLVQAVEKQLDELTSENGRILWTLKRLAPATSENAKLVGKRLQEIEDLDPKAANFLPKAEKLMKQYTVEAAVHQADEAVKKSSLWGPFKWLARQGAKLVAILTARFSLRQSLWNFARDKNTNDKMRGFLWHLVNYKPQMLSRPNRELEKDLQEKLSEALKSNHLVPWLLRGPASSGLASFLVGKNFIDMLA